MLAALGVLGSAATAMVVAPVFAAGAGGYRTYPDTLCYKHPAGQRNPERVHLTDVYRNDNPATGAYWLHAEAVFERWDDTSRSYVSTTASPFSQEYGPATIGEFPDDLPAGSICRYLTLSLRGGFPYGRS